MQSTPDDSTEPLLLIVAYKRFENVFSILKVAKEAGVTRALVHVDRAKVGDSLTGARQEGFIRELGTASLGLNVEVRVTEKNVGCAVNVLRGVDAAFGGSQFCYILEDDCIPTIDFFQFATESQKYLSANNDLWLTCGTQFVPNTVTDQRTIVSSFALTWGWYTDAKKWLEIRESLFSEQKGAWHEVPFKERRYWKSGRRRALLGITDVWDTILVSKMREFGKKSILPPECLVQNIGGDEAATHTVAGSEWLHQVTGNFSSPILLADPQTNSRADDWITRNVFKISYRHILTTLLTQMLDLFKLRNRKFSDSLITRLGNLPTSL